MPECNIRGLSLNATKQLIHVHVETKTQNRAVFDHDINDIEDAPPHRIKLEPTKFLYLKR